MDYLLYIEDDHSLSLQSVGLLAWMQAVRPMSKVHVIFQNYKIIWNVSYIDMAIHALYTIQISLWLLNITLSCETMQDCPRTVSHRARVYSHEHNILKNNKISLGNVELF